MAEGDQLSAPAARPARGSPLGWEDFRAAFGREQVVSTMLLFVFVTLCGQGAHHVMHGTLSWAGPVGVALPWAMWLFSAVMLGVVQHQVRDPSTMTLPSSYWVLSASQLMWMLWLAWFGTAGFAMLVILLLVFGSLHDTRYFYDDPKLLWLATLLWPLWLGSLLLLDLLGGPGLLDRLDAEPGRAWAAIVSSAVLAPTMFLVLRAAGVHWLALDTAVFEQGQIEKELAVARREREVVTRTCDLLESGLSAAQFSHDVRSPVSVVASCTEELNDLIEGVDEPLRADLREVLHDLSSAQQELLWMTSSLVRSLQATEVTSHPISDVVQDAVNRAATLTSGAMEPVMVLPDAQIWSSEHHVSTVANLIANGQREAPERPVEIHGEVREGGWLHLSVRDHGIDPADRPEALRRVRAALDLSRRRSEGSSAGYGVALVLAKVQLLRHGGSLAVMAPEDGRGLVVHLALPGVSAVDADPEQQLSAWGVG